MFFFQAGVFSFHRTSFNNKFSYILLLIIKFKYINCKKYLLPNIIENNNCNDYVPCFFYLNGGSISINLSNKHMYYTRLQKHENNQSDSLPPV